MNDVRLVVYCPLLSRDDTRFRFVMELMIWNLEMPKTCLPPKAGNFAPKQWACSCQTISSATDKLIDSTQKASLVDLSYRGLFETWRDDDSSMIDRAIVVS
jgi:hypothetical protein